MKQDISQFPKEIILHSAQDSYYGVVSADFNVKAIVDGREITMSVGVLEYEDSIECYMLVIYNENNEYQFLCDYIEGR